MVFRFPFMRAPRVQSLSQFSGKKFRHGRTLSMDAVSQASSTPRFRVYIAQVSLCLILLIYICLPSHMLRQISTKASNLSSAVAFIRNSNTSALISLPLLEATKFAKRGMDQSGVAIVAACKNRQETLSSVLPAWRAVEGIDEIVIVDWNSKPPLKPIVDAQSDERIKLIRVIDEKDWVLSRAYNLAVNNTRHDFVVRTDCDYSLKPDLLSAHDLTKAKDGFYAGNWNLARDSNEIHLNGAMIFNRKTFLSVGGYDERIQTYGWDDEDLYTRLTSRNLKKLNISYDHVTHVSHGDKKRAQEGVKFAQVQIDLNQLLLEKLPEWSKDEGGDLPSRYTVLKDTGRYIELRANFIPSSLQRTVKGEQFEESWSLALGRRLADDFRVPWDLLESVPSTKREVLLRSLMSLQTKLDAIHSNSQGTDTVDEDAPSKPNILERMNLDVAPIKARILVIHAMHGLGNRMRAIGSGLSFAESTGRVPVLIWESDAHIAADYDALFKSETLTVVKTFKPTWPLNNLKKWDSSWGEFKFYNYMEMEEGAKKGELITNEPDKHIYYKGAYIMEAPRHTSWDLDNQKLRSLQPVESVTEMIQKLDNLGLRQAIGVHIRNRTLQHDIKNVDFNKEYGSKAAAEMQHWREASSYLNFVVEMKRIIDEQDPDAKFYIATDTKEVIGNIESIFPGRILYVPRSCDDRDSECVKFAVIDVYALSRTRRLLGSNWSSYTELAERLGGLKAELAGQDFGVKKTNKEGSENALENEPETESSVSSSSVMFDLSRE